MLSSRAISSETMPSFRRRSAFPRTASWIEKSHIFIAVSGLRISWATLAASLPDGSQLFGDHELIAAPLQAGTGVADVRHQVAKMVAHHPQFVFLGRVVSAWRSPR